MTLIFINFCYKLQKPRERIQRFQFFKYKVMRKNTFILIQKLLKTF